ncbi:hypothetical protein GOP47_0001778 [Adiantum capillus-veneris]|uniref:Remorin C-terminal domain-containing protein n=1 Tax=Adiantum capillus-veneris TaxID=13818 RepID=A0A9D4V8W7_ADICA|nr:hypothetical protein GOP47_0001778 [Adiantum capillus-veneris]
MKVRQQQQLAEGTTSTPIHISRLSLNKLRPLGSEGLLKEGFNSMSNCSANDYLERDESPISVISHSATIVSQPSSACTSMEHHLSRLIRNPNRQRITNPSHQSPLSQSMATSGASTSEDDSSANYALSTLFIAVSPKEEESPLQQGAHEQAYSSNGLVRKGLNNKHYSEKFATKATNRSPNDSEVDHTTTGWFNSEDDDDHMISIDIQGLQEDPIVLRASENFHKNNGNKLTEEEQKSALVGKFSAISKHYNGELKEDSCRLSRTTSSTHKEFLSVRPMIHLSAPKAATHFDAVSNSRAGADLSLKTHEHGPLKGPQKASNIAPSLVSRQRSVNYTKLAVPSKWDEAEKWLCYDNHHGSHQHKVKSSSISQQTSLTSNHSTSSSGGRLIGINKQLSCKEDCASPSGRGLSGNDKASECRSDQSSASSSRGKLSVLKAREYKDNGAYSMLSRHLVLQNTNAASGGGAHCNVDVASSSSTLMYASQSPSLNEIFENGSQTCGHLDALKCKWDEIPKTNTSVSNYMGSGEIANPHYVIDHRNVAALSVSDGEVSRQVNRQQGCIASQMSASTGPMPGEKKTKDSTVRPTSIRNWISRSNSDALQTSCKCDDMRSRANWQTVATGMCASDGEVCENYASDQKLKSSASYTQRFKQHQILQKLRRKCSPRKAAYTGVQLCKTEEKVGGNMASTNACMQKEFVVHTPTHGRSASMKDACTEVSPSLSRRDMGTQMTPPASSPITSKCTSPLQNTSPARHNTPTRTSPTSNWQDNYGNPSGDSENEMNSRCDNVSALVLESDHWAKLELRDPPPAAGAQAYEKISDLCNEWSPAYGLAEEEIVDSKEGSEGHSAQDEVYAGGIILKRAGALEARAAAWEEAERAKFNAKFKREEARIKSWESLQKAKAEADLKKLEVKLERLRSKATEKVMSRMAGAQKRADEMRATAEAQQTEQMKKLRERACSLRRNALFPGSFAVCFARNYMP